MSQTPASNGRQLSKVYKQMASRNQMLVFFLTFSNPLFIGHLVIPLLTASIIIDLVYKRDDSRNLYVTFIVAFIAYSIKRVTFYHDS